MLTTPCARSSSKLTAFAKETRGATAVLFALLAVPVFGIGMAAIDYGIALTSKNKFQDAADAATNAGAGAGTVAGTGATTCAGALV